MDQRTQATPPEINKTMSPFEWGLLITLSLLWGGAFFFTGVAVKELPTFTVVVCRVSLAAMILYLIVKIMGHQMPTSIKIWGAFFGMGFLNNAIPFSLLVWGQSHIASGLASILNASTPLFAVVIAHWLTVDEKMTDNRLIGVIVGFAGIAVMVGGEALQHLGNDVFAQLACIGAAISYSFAGIFGRRFKKMGLTSMVTATGQVTASSLLLIPAMLIVDQPWTLPVPSLPAIGALVGIASLSTALAYIIYFRILATAGATNLMLVTFLIPASAILLGVMFLNETLLPRHYMGMITIGFGLAAIDGRLWEYIKSIRARQL